MLDRVTLEVSFSLGTELCFVAHCLLISYWSQSMPGSRTLELELQEQGEELVQFTHKTGEIQGGRCDMPVLR